MTHVFFFTIKTVKFPTLRSVVNFFNSFAELILAHFTSNNKLYTYSRCGILLLLFYPLTLWVVIATGIKPDLIVKKSSS